MPARDGPRPFGGPSRTPGRGRTRFLALILSAAAHIAVFVALFLARAPIPLHDKPGSSLLLVSLAALPKAAPPGQAPPGAAADSAAGGGRPAPQVPVPRPAAPVPAAAGTPASDTSDLLSEAQVAGAAHAGEGGAGGGGCDLAQAVQQALRRDPLVRTAVADVHRLGKTVMLWNGDWVRSGGQDGKGLSAVREAVIWAVAFAPQACRDARMHGLVLLSLGDEGTRFAIGSEGWRWSDLLGLRQGPG
jgi:hypothetical protein